MVGRPFEDEGQDIIFPDGKGGKGAGGAYANPGRATGTGASRPRAPLLSNIPVRGQAGGPAMVQPEEWWSEDGVSGDEIDPLRHQDPWARLRPTTTQDQAVSPFVVNWRSRYRLRDGPVPPAPKFDGDVDKDSKCLRRFLLKFRVWRKLVSLQLAPEELAIRVIAQFDNEAADEHEEDDNLERFEAPNGLDILVQELKDRFPSDESHQRHQVVDEFEKCARKQHEGLQHYVKQFDMRHQDDYLVQSMLRGAHLFPCDRAAILTACGKKLVPHRQGRLDNRKDR